ncbi:MAG TPA: VWA domain-containing protein [Thermoanaerobaculia bacterium]|nr:VWA domain-containing protein [Thermoanaerobaculia bacterium]
MALGFALLAHPIALGVAQEPPADAGFGEQIGVGFVLVPVVVRTSDGYSKSLKVTDFRLFVDDQPVAIESFENRSDAPLSTVFLQDLSGSMDGAKLAASREVLRHFLEQATPLDELAIATFADGQTTVDVPFTSDLVTLEEAVTTWEAFGTTTLNDAVAWLPEISAGGSHSKRAAVLITDGAENASTLSPADARDIVRRAQVPVYVLGLGSGSPYEVGSDGAKLHRFADVLNLLALYTGGRYFPVSGPNEAKEAVVDIVDDLRHQYVLGFSTSASGKRAQRRIRVEVDERNVRVLSRQGYTGTPPLAPAGKN